MAEPNNNTMIMMAIVAIGVMILLNREDKDCPACPACNCPSTIVPQRFFTGRRHPPYIRRRRRPPLGP